MHINSLTSHYVEFGRTVINEMYIKVYNFGMEKIRESIFDIKFY